MAPELATAGLADFIAANSSLLASLHAQSQASRWDVSSEEFAAALYRSASRHFGTAQLSTTSAAAPAFEAYLRGLHLADLALCCALLRGSETAWTEFVAQYRPSLYAAARAVVGAAGETCARDLADSLYADLYGVDDLDRSHGARKPLLVYFHGRSKLTTWLRALLAQKFVDSLRVSQRFQPLDDGREQNVSPGRPNPPYISSASSHAANANSGDPNDGDPDRRRLIPHLREAFVETLAALPAADRLLLALYYVQQLMLAQIARLRGVHEATISRQLERLRRDLRANVEHALAAGRAPETGRAGRAGLSPAEIQLCFSYALEDWPFDLGSHLLPNASPQNIGEP